jgi:hypothetical protein
LCGLALHRSVPAIYSLMPHGVKSTDLVTKGLVVTLTQAFSQGPKRGRLILVQWYMYSKEGGGGGGGGGGSRKRLSGNLNFTLLIIHVSICSKLVRNFSTTLGFVILCPAMLLYSTTTFSGTPSNRSKCQMYNNNEYWSYFVSDILIYLGK